MNYSYTEKEDSKTYNCSDGSKINIKDINSERRNNSAEPISSTSHSENSENKNNYKDVSKDTGSSYISSILDHSWMPKTFKLNSHFVSKRDGESDSPQSTDKNTGTSFLSSTLSKVGLSMKNTSANIDDTTNSKEKEFDFWSFSSVSNTVSKVTVGARTVLQKGVSNAPFLAEFNRKQTEFIEGKVDTSARTENHVLEQIALLFGNQGETELKAKILDISQDRRNFLRSPPSGVAFTYDINSPNLAEYLLSQDTVLESMRYELVPKIVTEDTFWRNYFYRVGLVMQSFELKGIVSLQETSKLASTENKVISDNSVSVDVINESAKKFRKEEPDDEWEKELEGDLREFDVLKDADADVADVESQIQDLLNEQTS